MSNKQLIEPCVCSFLLKKIIMYWSFYMFERRENMTKDQIKILASDCARFHWVSVPFVTS